MTRIPAFLILAFCVQGCAKKNEKPNRRPPASRKTEASPIDANVVHARPRHLGSLESVIKEIAKEKQWKSKADGPTPELLASVLPKIGRWCDFLMALSAQGKRKEADELARAIVDLRNHLGTKLIPPSRFNAFARDRFKVKEKVVLAAQFFEPVPFYPGDSRLLKLYRFSVYEGKKVVARYYLEKSRLVKDYYVLGHVSGTRHRQVQPYGERQPTYWELKARVIQDLGFGP